MKFQLANSIASDETPQKATSRHRKRRLIWNFTVYLPAINRMLGVYELRSNLGLFLHIKTYLRVVAQKNWPSNLHIISSVLSSLGSCIAGPHL